MTRPDASSAVAGAASQEALVYKGGRLVPAYKRVSPISCDNCRSLFVSSPV